MIYILILVYLIILPITILMMLYRILEQLENKNNVQEQNISVIAKRNRHNIQTNDYNNVFNNRTEYQDYQNKKGLYEPILKPHKPGKRIEKKED